MFPGTPSSFLELSPRERMTCQRSACGLFFADNNSIRTTLRYEVCAFVEPFHDRYLQSSNWCVDLLGRAGVTDQLVLAEFKPGGGGGGEGNFLISAI